VLDLSTRMFEKEAACPHRGLMPVRPRPAWGSSPRDRRSRRDVGVFQCSGQHRASTPRQEQPRKQERACSYGCHIIERAYVRQGSGIQRALRAAFFAGQLALITTTQHRQRLGIASCVEGRDGLSSAKRGWRSGRGRQQQRSYREEKRAHGEQPRADLKRARPDRRGGCRGRKREQPRDRKVRE
jgi:hypothetical protein